LTIGITPSRNKLGLPIEPIHHGRPIATTNINTYLEKVDLLRYSGNTENNISNTANTNTILQY